MSIGIGTKTLIATSIIGGGAAAAYGRRLNERQERVEQAWLEKPLAEQNAWLRDDKPGMPKNWFGTIAAVTAVTLGGMGGLATAMNLGAATPVMRTMTGFGAGMAVTAGVSMLLDAAG